MMLIRLQTRKVGHDLDLKISFKVIFHTVKLSHHEFDAFGESDK